LRPCRHTSNNTERPTEHASNLCHSPKPTVLIQKNLNIFLKQNFKHWRKLFFDIRHLNIMTFLSIAASGTATYQPTILYIIFLAAFDNDWAVLNVCGTTEFAGLKRFWEYVTFRSFLLEWPPRQNNSALFALRLNGTLMLGRRPGLQNLFRYFSQDNFAAFSPAPSQPPK
jgi:hypothetical protein